MFYMKDSHFKAARSVFTFLTLYGLWCLALKIVTKTLITYFSRSAQSPLHDIADAFSSSGLFVAAIAAFSFSWLSKQLQFNPSRTLSYRWDWRETFSEHKLKFFLPGFFQGTMLAMCLVGGLIANGDYVILSAFVPFNEPLSGVLSLLLRSLALVLLITKEDQLYRTYITPRLEPLNLPQGARFVLLGASYWIIKSLQFDLGMMQGLTVFLLGSVVFSFHTPPEYPRATGFLIGLLGIIHIFFGNPIFASNFSGLFLIGIIESESRFKVFFNGGLGGPLSSFALQVILLVLFLSRAIRTSKGIRTHGQ